MATRKKKERVKKEYPTETLNITNLKETGADKESLLFVKNSSKWQKPTYTWKPPANFKSFWVRVRFRTAQDGMMNGGVRAERYVGTIEEGKDLRKVFDMGSYDADTVQALATRLAMATFHSTGRPKKSGIGTRLPGNTIIELHIRVTASKGVNLKATISKIFATQRIKRKVVKHQIGKSDPTYRYFRKMNAHLGAAFLNCLETPKGGSKYHQLQNEAKNED